MSYEPNILDEIVSMIEQEKGWKGISYSQVFHYIPTEFIDFQKKGIFLSRNILWVDVDKLKQKILIIFTKDPQIAEIVKKVAKINGMVCEEKTRDHFPPAFSLI